mgnify:FL=1
MIGAATGFLAAVVVGAVAGCAMAAEEAAVPVGDAEAWPNGRWNEKLGAPYEAWKPAQEALRELAARGGAADVAFEAETKAVFMVPLAADLTLREALEAAAATCGLKAAWKSGRLTVAKAARPGNWIELVGGKAEPIQVGEARGTLVLPRRRDGDGPLPWVWHAPNGLDPSHSWLVGRLLREGVAVAVVNVGESQGNPAGRATFTAFYETLTNRHGLAKRAVLLPQSRGGLMHYNWAAEYPECVAAIGGIYTVCDLRSYPGMDRAAAAYGMSKDELEAVLTQHNPIDRLAPLVKAGVEVFHVHGDKDGTVPVERNAGELVRRYKALGGKAELLVVPGKGHEVLPEFFRCRELADFLTSRAKAGAHSR